MHPWIDSITTKLGSFWTRDIDTESKAQLRLLLEAVLLSRMPQSLKRSVSAFLDSGNTVQDFFPISVPENYDGITLKRIFPFFPKRIIVAHNDIRSADVDYVLNADTGFIQFLQPADPEEGNTFLFLDNIEFRKYGHPLSGLYGFNSPTPISGTSYAASYLRGSTQTPEGLRDALCEAAGLVKIKENTSILSSTSLPFCDGFRYDSTTGAYWVTYPHNELTGDIDDLWAGGESIQVHYGDKKMWWKSPFTPDILWEASGLRLQDWWVLNSEETLTAYKGHPVFPLYEDPFGVSSDGYETFWDSAFTRSADGLELLFDVGDTINPLDFVFEYFLDHGLLVLLDATVLGHSLTVLLAEWVLKNVPLGYIPIIRVKYSVEWYDYKYYTQTFLEGANSTHIISGDPFFLRYGVPFDFTTTAPSGAMVLDGNSMYLNGFALTMND